MTGLIRRGARYAIRRVIPKDLQEHYKAREIVRALGTSDLKEAKRLHALMWVKLDEEFERCRERLAGRAISDPKPRSTPETISDAEFDWQMQQLELDRQQSEEDEIVQYSSS